MTRPRRSSREELHLLEVVLRKLDGGGPRKVAHPGRRRRRADRAARRAGRGQARGPGLDPGADAPDRGAVAPARQGRQAAGRSQVALLRPPAPGRGRQAARRADRRAQLRRAGRRRADRRLAQRARLAPLLPLRGGRRLRGAPGRPLVEGEVLARRTVAIVDAELRRVAAPQGTFSRDLRTGEWRAGGDAAGAAADRARRQRGGGRPARRRRARRRAAAAARASRGKLGLDDSGAAPARPPPARDRGADRSAPVRADHAAVVGPDRGPGLGGQRQDHHRPAPHRLPGLRRAAPLPPRADAGHRLPARAGGVRVARAAVAGRRGRAGDDVRRLGRGGAQGGAAAAGGAR